MQGMHYYMVVFIAYYIERRKKNSVFGEENAIFGKTS